MIITIVKYPNNIPLVIRNNNNNNNNCQLVIIVIKQFE